MFLFSFPAKASTAIAIFSCLFLLAACSEQNSSESLAKKPTTQKTSEAVITTATQSTSTSINSKAPLLEVYKSPTCSCCEKWIDHIDQHGFMFLKRTISMTCQLLKATKASRHNTAHVIPLFQKMVMFLKGMYPRNLSTNF